MKRAQIISLAIAGVCGLGVVMLMRGMTEKPREVQKEVQAPTVKVLVARNDIGLGTVTTESHFRWQDYPESAPPPGAIICRSANCSMKEYAGGIARTPMLKEELITRTKLAKAGDGGVLASILPEGMRAISAKIEEHSSAGKLILPNDHVDVILNRRLRSRNGQEEHEAVTILRNVRVLAIGQRIDVQNGQKQADGNTATLELTPRQAERLALAKAMGDITLVLRSIADFERDGQGPSDAEVKGQTKSGDAVKFMRYGVRSRSQSLN